MACAFFILAGIAIHPSLLVLLFVLGPFLLLEMHMLRRSGNRSLPLIRAAVQPYEPGSGAVDVIIELEPNPNGDRRPN